jgi:hypothetical protein
MDPSQRNSGRLSAFFTFYSLKSADSENLPNLKQSNCCAPKHSKNKISQTAAIRRMLNTSKKILSST